MKAIIATILLLTFNTFLYSSNYENSWKTVESFYSKNRPKSALKEVDIVYDKAVKEHNETQKIKALIYQLTYIQNVEENSLKKMITKLEKQIQNEKGISKYILHSITASLYWDFYSRNRYKILNRHNTDIKNTDIDKMSLQELTAKVIFHYKKSLDIPQNIKTFPIKKFATILNIEKESDNLRPYLYDILSYRALAFFNNSEASLNKPNDVFHIMDSKYFQNYNKFSNLNIKATDKNSFKYISLKIYQDLIKFHLNDKNKSALYDVNLHRLKYIYSKTFIENKDDLYENQLIEFSKIANNASSLFSLAMFYKNLGDKFNSKENNTHFKKDKFPSFEKAIIIKKNPYFIKAYNLCKKGQNKFKKYINFKNLEKMITKKNISITVENTENANKPFLILAKYNNIDKLYGKIISTTLEKSKNFGSIRWEKKLDFFKLSDEEESFEFQLPKTKDYTFHSIEIKAPALPSGKYFLAVSNDENFDKNSKISYTIINISDISYTYKNKNGNLYFNVFNRETGQPLEDVKAEIYIRKYNRKEYEMIKQDASFMSNKNGEIVINNKDLSTRSSFFIKFSIDDDYLITKKNFYISNYTNNRNYARKRTYIFTDRSIYKPGQMVYFKGLLTKNLKNKNEIVTNEKIEITCTDVNYKKIMEENYTTDDFGTFNGSFQIPNKILNGYINIQSQGGSRRILVQEYKKPNFKVNLTPQTNLKLNSIITVKGLAEGYGGYKISNAKVKYKITRKSKSFFPFYIPFAQNKTIISSGETKTDKSGDFSIEFTAKPDISISKERDPIFIFEVNAEIYDSNNEMVTINTNINIGYKPIYLDLDIAKMIDKNTRRELKIKLDAQNSMNKPIALKGELFVYKVKSEPTIKIKRLWDMPDLTYFSKNEFEKSFPYFKYNQKSNLYNRGEKVYSHKFDFKNNNLLDLTKFKTNDPGIYEIEVKGFDKHQNPVTENKYISLYSDKTFPYDKPFYSFCNKDSITLNENAFINLIAKEDDLNIILETYKDGTYKKEIIKMHKGSKKIKIAPSKKDKLIEIRATAITHGRIFEFNHKIVVNNTKPLTISLKSKKEIFKCGENGEFEIKINELNNNISDFGCVMYDASLDAIEPHIWNLNLRKNNSSNFKRIQNIFSTSFSNNLAYNKSYPITQIKYSSLNLFRLRISKFDNYRQEMFGVSDRMYFKNSRSSGGKSKGLLTAAVMKAASQESNKNDIKIRKDFAETVFFYPSLKTDKDGNLKVKFKLPQSVTEWKFMGIAHTKDLKTAFIEKKIKTIKELIITPNLPRFVRENDLATLYSKIDNMSDKNLSIGVKYEVYNGFTDEKLFTSKDIDKFTLNTNASKTVSYKFEVPKNLKLLKILITANSKEFNDKIVKFIPVQSLEREVFETKPFFVNEKENKTIIFDLKNKSKIQNITLEYASNPIWHVLTALPYISSENDKSSLSVFRKFYANFISSYIFDNTANLGELFQIHKQDNNENIFASNLDRNTELKKVALEMTPWLQNANNETMQKEKLSKFLNKNQNNYAMETSLNKLEKLQKQNGLWSWFSQMNGNRYTTMEILSGLGRAYHLNAKKNRINNLASKALNQIENEIHEDYLKLEKKQILKRVNLNSFYIKYLYAKSFFDKYKTNTKNVKIFKYFKTQAKKYWQNFDIKSQGKIAIALYRFGDKETAKEILESIKEHFLYSKEFGIYIKKRSSNEEQLQTQIILIEAFGEIGIYKKDIPKMKLWLLKQKQTTKWKTPKITVDACYALLFENKNWDLKSATPEIFIDNRKIKLDNFNGYLKMNIPNNKFKSIKINNNSSSPAWGGLYLKYLVDEDKIKAHSGKISIKKEIFLRTMTKSGIKLKSVKNLKVGDNIYVKLEVNIDRNLDFVHIRDSRSACFEAGNIKPKYTYQNGAYYYSVTNNNATNMFFEHLNKGYYTFEYTATIERIGDYSTGITDIGCLYSPEFSGHSKGGRVKIDE